MSARAKNFATRAKKPKKCPCKKSGRAKSEKWVKKWACKSKSARAKIEKMAKNGLHGHFLLARGRKKTLPQSGDV